jgi:hypothetical protein
MADVKSTIMISAKQLQRESKSIRTASEEMCPKPTERIGVTNHIIVEDGKFKINFGKAKGKNIESVDKGYLKWMISSDFPEPVKDFVKKYI